MSAAHAGIPELPGRTQFSDCAVRILERNFMAPCGKHPDFYLGHLLEPGLAFGQPFLNFFLVFSSQPFLFFKFSQLAGIGQEPVQAGNRGIGKG